MAIALICAAAAVPATAQNWTTISASNITDAAGNKLAAGQICFLGTDQNNVAINFAIGGGGQVLKRPVCATVTNGAIAAGFQVPNPANTSPAGVLYHVYVRDTSSGQIVVDYKLVRFTGTAWDLDNYQPSSTTVPPPPTPASVTGPLNVNGNMSISGTSSLGVTTASSLTASSVNQRRFAPFWCNSLGTFDESCWTNAIATLSSAGGEVDGGPYTYTFNAMLTVAGSGIVLRGNPQPMSTGSIYGSTRITTANGANLSALIKVTGAGDVVKNLTLDGNKTNETCAGTEANLLYSDSARPEIEDVSTQNSCGAGWEIYSSSTSGANANLSGGGNVINTMSLNNAGSACLVKNTADTSLRGDQCENSTVGLELDSAPTTRVIGGDLGGNARQGLYCHGIANFGSFGGIITGVQFGNNGGSGTDDILINGWDEAAAAHNACVGFSIAANEFISSPTRAAASWSAIHLQDSADNAVTGNRIGVASGATSYKYDIQISQSAATEGRDTVSANRLSGWVTQAILPQTNTFLGGNATGDADQPELYSSMVVQTGTPGNVALTAKAAAGQAADVFDVVDANDDQLARVNAAGVIYSHFLDSMSGTACALSGFLRLCDGDTVVGHHAVDVQVLTVNAANQTQVGDSHGVLLAGPTAIGSGSAISSSGVIDQYIGDITTTAAASDPLTVPNLTNSSRCHAQAANAVAASLTGVYIVEAANTVTLYHSATAGGDFHVFCAMQ